MTRPKKPLTVTGTFKSLDMDKRNMYPSPASTIMNDLLKRGVDLMGIDEDTINKRISKEREMARTRVYVAGAYSAINVMTVLDNMRKGMRVGSQLLQLGFAPFVPWLDHHLQFMLREGESLTVQDYYDYSMSWLEASDVVLVLPGWEESKGTKEEIKRAEELEIDVYFSLNDLLMDALEVMPKLKQRRNIVKIDW